LAEALELRRVNALYGESHVLHEVSLAMRPGRLLALLGRNGAGKTTCLNTIIGFLPARDGEILLYGEPIARLGPETIARRGVGLVPQGRRVFASLTVDENLRVALRPPAGRAAAAWTLETAYAAFPKLAERRRQPAGLLSGGEQQMLAIARALVSNPRVLLLDEPSEGLAPLIVHEVGETLLALKAQGYSILLVEQNTTLALRVADDVAILNTGRIVYHGSAEDVRGKSDLLHQNLGVL
jgi:branched-chain amino acid transport system ATP-binding protein